MNSTRQTLALALAFTAIVFCWASFYIPTHDFRWVLPLVDGDYGLCHLKSWIYLAIGSRTPAEGIQISPHVASVIVTLIIGIFSLPMLLIWQYLEKKTKETGQSPKAIPQ